MPTWAIWVISQGPIITFVSILVIKMHGLIVLPPSNCILFLFYNFGERENFQEYIYIAETPVLTKDHLNNKEISTNLVVANHVFAKYITMSIIAEV